MSPPASYTPAKRAISLVRGGASLALQVRVLNTVTAAAGRTVSFVSFTVPQYQRDERYFAPLAELTADPGTELNFALVPYHPADQAPGTTDDQVRLIDAALAASPRRQPRLGHLHRMRDGPRGLGRDSRATRPAPRGHRGGLTDHARMPDRATAASTASPSAAPPAMSSGR